MTGLNQQTGLYTYADGSTYQNPNNYGTAEKPQWALTGAQAASIFDSDRAAAVNAANGWDGRSILNGGSGVQNLGGSSSQVGAFGAGGGGTYQNKPMTNLGMGGQQASGSNPYLGQHAAAITNQVTQNLQRNILPNIGGGAMAAGGYGGSRQGVVEANALNDANQGLSNALAGMYSQDWNAQQGRDLQRYGMDQSFNLGMGNLGLGAMNANNNFFTAQRGQDLQAAGLGAQLVQQGNQGFLNQGQGMFNIGNTYQNAPWQTIGNFGSAMSPWAGATGTTTGSQGGNPWASAMGGALGGWQLGSMFK
jgi:hypothetical protein